MDFKNSINVLSGVSEYDAGDLRDSYYRLTDGIYGSYLSELKNLPEDVAKANGIDKRKEIKIFEQIKKLVGQSDIGGWL